MDEALGAIIARLDRIEARLAGSRPRNPIARAVGKRAAARLLGVDRATTLDALIRSGRLRTVEIGGRVRVPVAEVERLLAEGAAGGPRRRRTRTARSAGDAIRAIDIDD